jgi:CubicO group peptidase (beta-lactamase class C family)
VHSRASVEQAEARSSGSLSGVGEPATRPSGMTADSWQEWPHHRWAFQHIDEVLGTVHIPRGHGPVLELTVAEPLDLPDLDAELRARCTDGLVVLHHREIRLERYQNHMDRGTRHLLMSVSKSFTSAVFGQYVARGEVDVREPVATYVPALAGSAYGDASVQETLDMTVAVAYDEAYEDPQSEVQRHDRSAGWRARRAGDPAGVREFLTTLRKDGDHGQTFRYCSANTDVLAWILEEVSGRPFSELLASELWSRLGAESDAFATVDAEGFVYANAGICTTVRDLARFGRMVLDGGVGADGTPLVPRAWIDDIRNGGSPDTDFSAMPTALPHGSYRNQFWVTGDEHGCFAAVGIFGQLVWMNPVHDTVVATVSSLPEADDDDAFTAHVDLLHRLSETS